ncbi:MAG: signal peptidase I [Campylobacterota bacterium]|nr:signal peptidase I [Campylobacterota bacterium]
MKEKSIKFAKHAYRFSNTWPGTIIIVLMIIFFVAQAFRIPSGSMKDSLLIGDHLFAKKFAYGIATPHLPFLEIPLVPGTDGHIIDGDKPERGDIVIFRYPNNHKLHYVKRCVAVEGDELFLIDKSLYLHPHQGNDYIKANYPESSIIVFAGKLWIKDPYMKDHPGIHHDPKIIDDGRNPQPIFNLPVIRVPENEFFMMGDNRDHSNDSRFWGSVPYGLVEGTPWFIYFSMDDNYEIRWDRMFKTPSDLEEKEYLDRAVAERLRTDKEDYGLY